MNFFLSPGFGGLCAVIGADIAYAAATVCTRQKARADAEIRRQAEIPRAWDRFAWLVQHRDTLVKPVILGLLERIARTDVGSGDGELTAFCRPGRRRNCCRLPMRWTRHRGQHQSAAPMRTASTKERE